MKKTIWKQVFLAVILFPYASPAEDLCARPVMTAAGMVRGMSETETTACAYKGIPFAAPPTGALRWRPPRPPVQISGVLDAQEFGAQCSQTSPVPIGKGPSGSEDCLFLNVWRPAKEGVFPVMVWIHGGGFSRGSASTPMYWGDRLAAGGNLVVVTFNYRLGAFGFLAHPELSELDEHGSSGNYGFLDQVEALRWIRDNIAEFGGDPENVTIFGESAGGRSVCFHLASPLSKGLFQKAILESGSCDTINTMEEGFESAGKIAAAMGCPEEDQLECLLGKSSEEIAAVSGEFSMSLDEVLLLDRTQRTWLPHIDGWAFKEVPIDSLRSGNYNQVPLMAGSTKDEFKLFFAAKPGFRSKSKSGILKMVAQTLPEPLLPVFERLYPFDMYKKPADAYIDAKGDVFMGCNTFEAVEASARYQPTYYYRFDYDDHRLPGYLGAAHGAEIPFIFNGLDRPVFKSLYSRSHRRKARPMVETMMTYWANFAHHGQPGEAGSVSWPLYNNEERLRIYLDQPVTVAPADNVEKCEFWKEQGIVK